MKQITQILIIAMLLLCSTLTIAQKTRVYLAQKKQARVSSQLKKFKRLTAEANISFIFPKGFKEIKVLDNEDFSFDYAIELPGKDFEIWFQVKSEKENRTGYLKNQNNKNLQLSNPDSLYSSLGAANAKAFTGDKNYLERTIPPDYLARYHADAGKSYLLTLLDMPETKHYKYALLITLQKYHTGTILAICFSNENGPEFFKDINMAGNCLIFKP